jgi:type IV secretory pathway VirB3-like protein
MLNDPSKQKSAVSEDQGFENRRVFTSQSEIMGLPATLFFAGAGLVVAFFVLIGWWAALLIGAVFFPPMYHIHREDPRGLQVWVRAMRRSNSLWGAGRLEPLDVIFMDRE